MKTDMNVMIHVPEYADDCTFKMLDVLSRYLALFDESSELLEAAWNFEFDDEGHGLNARHYTQENRWLENDMDMVRHELARRKCAHFGVIAYFHEDIIKSSLLMSARTAKSIDYPKPSVPFNGRYIRIDIASRLWRHVDHDAIIQVTKDACIALNACYACIDESAPINGIDGALFKYCATDSENVDVESRLPGIYWVQFVTESMVEKTGAINDIVNRVPCDRAEIFDSNNRKMLFMQIAQDTRKDTHRRRLAMREFFKDSLYRISLEKTLHCTNWSHWLYLPVSNTNWALRQMKRTPLTNDEIEEIIMMNQEIIKIREKRLKEK